MPCMILSTITRKTWYQPLMSWTKRYIMQGILDMLFAIQYILFIIYMSYTIEYIESR